MPVWLLAGRRGRDTVRTIEMGGRYWESYRRRMADPDSWQVSQRRDEVWVTRELARGWVLAHRVVLQAGRPVIAATRLQPADPNDVPVGGIGSDLLRRITVRGAADAAALPSASVLPDLRRLDPENQGTRRAAEARTWSLVVTAGAYVHAVRGGSPRPNEDVAESLGIRPPVVRDRIHKARAADPPLLTGGGRRGFVGQPELTPAAVRVLQERVSGLIALAGYPAMSDDPRVRRLHAFVGALLDEQARRIPGFWTMTLEEIEGWARQARRDLPEIPHGSMPVPASEDEEAAGSEGPER